VVVLVKLGARALQEFNKKGKTQKAFFSSKNIFDKKKPLFFFDG